jgi:hypothetical protein
LNEENEGKKDNNDQSTAANCVIRPQSATCPQALLAYPIAE